MSTIFLVLALMSIVWGIVTSIMITSFLSRRGIKINYLFLRLFIFKYVSQYRKITMEETGKPGPVVLLIDSSVESCPAFCHSRDNTRNHIGA